MKRRLVTEEFKFHGVKYERRLVICNKAKCSKCPHGPYWYALVSVGSGKPVTRYVGKNLKSDTLRYYSENPGEVTVYGTPEELS